MRQAEAGYAALLALLTVALVSVAILATFSAQSAQRSAARQASAAMTLERAAASAQGRLGFLLLTEPMGARGPIVGGDRTATRQNANSQTANDFRNGVGGDVQELVLDGRSYEFADASGRKMMLQIQDAVGLISLNDEDPAPMARYLALRGVSPQEAAAMADSLADFADADHLRRAQGAERADYEALGQLPPRNAALTRASQAAGVLGWTGALKQAPALRAAFSVRDRDLGFNPNTAPILALRAALNLNLREARILVDAREDRSFQSAEDLAERSGLGAALATARIAARPNGDVTVRISDPENGKYGFAFRLRVRPEGAERPLQIEPIIGREVFLMETAYAGVRALPGGEHTDLD